MTYKEIKQVMDYCNQMGAAVQITGPVYDKSNGIEWVAHFLSNVHAKACYDELKGASHFSKVELVENHSSYRIQ